MHVCRKWVAEWIVEYYPTTTLLHVCLCGHRHLDPRCHITFASSSPGCFCTKERESVPHQICEVLAQSVRTVSVAYYIT